MVKTPRKGIVHKSKLNNIYNKKMTDDNWANYKQQRNFCVNLLRKTKKDHSQNLNTRHLSDNRKLWRKSKPYFTNKGLNSNKFLLKEKDNLVSNEKSLPLQ